MTWTYNVSSAEFHQNDVYKFDAEYCGAPGYQNDSAHQCVKNKGPLPIGSYVIGKPYNSPYTGRYTLPLTPHSSNDMCGRDGFKIHGDNQHANGTASQGCIIVPNEQRKEIWNSGDRDLDVI